MSIPGPATDYRPAPGGTIDLGDDRSVRHWTGHFGITLSQLEEAVLAAGNRVEDVDRHLREQGASAGAG